VGLIPDDTIAEIRTRADIVSVIGQHVQLKRAGRNWKGLCPFHGEKSPSFNVSPDKGFYYCFGCQKKGDAFTFLMEYQGKSFHEAAETLASELRLGGHEPFFAISDLLRATLRHRPDRILVGEVRGAEAFDLLQGLNTGHLGSLTTIHANSAEQALTRLAHCVLTANIGLPHRSTREAIALAIHLIVHIARQAGRRVVTEVVSLRRYDAQNEQFVLEAWSSGM